MRLIRFLLYRNPRADDSRESWYSMFTSNGSSGLVYDPVFSEWYQFPFPATVYTCRHVSTFTGLVCFIEKDGNDIHVWKPITNFCKRLKKVPDARAGSSHLAMLLTCYRAVIQLLHIDPMIWDLSVYVYFSDLVMWEPVISDRSSDWIPGNENIICGGVLYMVVHSTAIGWNSYAILHCNSLEQSAGATLFDSLIPVPCPLTSVTLINLRNKVVMVGGIKKPGTQVVLEGIGIWVLNGKVWEEICRMPQKDFKDLENVTFFS